MMTPEQLKGSRGTCETVRIAADNEQGYIVINAEDFNSSKHSRFDDAKHDATRVKKAAAAK